MKNIESIIYQYLVERGWDKLRPSDLAKSISIEAAELLEIFQWVSMDIKETKQDSKKMEEIKKELADIFIYAFDMAILLGIDTEKIIRTRPQITSPYFPLWCHTYSISYIGNRVKLFVDHSLGKN